MGGDEWLTRLAERMKSERENGSLPTQERLTVRQLLLEYGYYKRGSAINPRIRNQLEELGLRTVPDFENVWFGETIAIELDEEGSDRLQADPTHRVSMLDAANNRPVSVSPDAPINVATTLMLLHDYSQLPVTKNERRVREVVSWKSIGARLSLGCRWDYVRDCKEPARVVQREAPLLEVIGIVRHCCEVGLRPGARPGREDMRDCNRCRLVGAIRAACRPLSARRTDRRSFAQPRPPEVSARGSERMHCVRR